MAGESTLNERAQHLFRTLMARYLRDGQPVGSRTLSRDSGLDLSPATVRNVMADLEEMGLVRAPHTSAGRVPTVQGYRLFVDTMLQISPLEQEEIQRLRTQLGASLERDTLMNTVSALLSDVTHLAGVVTLPRSEVMRLRQVEFLPLSERRVLVILVVNNSEVQNRIITTARAYSAVELQQAANYVNEVAGGKDLRQVREHLLTELQQARERMNQIMIDAIEMARAAFTEPPGDDDFVVSGQTHLMEYVELADMEKLRQLFEAFNRKRDFLHLLDQSLQAQGVQIFIGEESGYDVLDDCSLVVAPYEVSGRQLGVLGVIGPTRMAYERVIPIVDVTARLLGAALNQVH